MIDVRKIPIEADRVERLDLVTNEVYLPKVNALPNHDLVREPLNYQFYSGYRFSSSAVAVYYSCVKNDLFNAKKWFYISELCHLRMYAEFEKGASSFMGGMLGGGF